MSWILLASVAVPAVGATLLAVVSNERDAARADRARRVAVWSSGLTLLASIAVLVSAAADGRLDLVLEDDDGWAVVGLTALRVEGSLLVLTSFVGLIVQSYASRSLVGDARSLRFHALALGLVAATNLTAVAASGFTFVVGWVATSMFVVGLVGHRRGWHAAVRSTRATQRAFGLGDLALLAGIVIATVSAGHLDLRAVGGAVAEIDSQSTVTLVALLFVVAGVARSALVPLGFWLPTTLAAPTPVSALLHAGVVNGAGVLFIRFSPVVGQSTAALVAAYVLGVATAVLATAIMIVRTDVKGSLVWSTAGQMGFMVAQLGAGAFAAAFFHLIGHAMYKAAAFLGAGDAIRVRNMRSFRPERHGRATPASVLLSIAAAAASVAAALWLLDPDLTDSGTALVATFATLTLARAVHGWAVTTALAANIVIPGAVLGCVAAAFAYIGGLKIVKDFVADELPFEVPDAVGAGWVIATVVIVAGAALLITRLPGPTGDDWRRAVYVRLVALGAMTAPTGASDAPAPLRSVATSAPAVPPAAVPPADSTRSSINS